MGLALRRSVLHRGAILRAFAAPMRSEEARQEQEEESAVISELLGEDVHVLELDTSEACPPPEHDMTCWHAWAACSCSDRISSLPRR
eukprot:scaffold3761_cov372-Prasinococcus_capsulatus_cf.AAC.19